VDGEPQVRPTLPVSVTLDHRYLSGAIAGRMRKAFVGYLEDEHRLRRDAGLEPAGTDGEGTPPEEASPASSEPA
jgi:hypothetical protein